MNKLKVVKICVKTMDKLYVVKNMGPMGPRGLGPIKTKGRKEGPGGRTGRKDRAEGPGRRTGRTDGPRGRTDRADGRTGRKEPPTPHPPQAMQ